MYFMPEDVQYERNMLLILTGIIKFVVVDGYVLISINILYHNRMNSTKKGACCRIVWDCINFSLMEYTYKFVTRGETINLIFSKIL